MTILVAVKKNDKVYIGADRITTFGSEYATDLVDSTKIMKLKHGYLATSGYTLLDNVIEHLHEDKSEILDRELSNRAQVFQFFLDLYGKMKKAYTLVDTGKETYAGIYNVFLLVTPTNIYGIANNLSVNEYDRYAAKGAGSDYSQGCLYALYDLMDDGWELTRIALEAACKFSVYCREPIDILEVKKSDFGKGRPISYKASGRGVKTYSRSTGLSQYRLVSTRSSGKRSTARKSATTSSKAVKKTSRSRSTTQSKKTSTRTTARKSRTTKSGSAGKQSQKALDQSTPESVQ